MPYSSRSGWRSPRVLLWLIAIEFGIVAWQTAGYPPTYLAFPIVWATVSGIGAVAALVAATHPTRATVAAAGALVVTVAAVRAVAVTQELLTRPFNPPETQASFIVAAAVWLFVAILLDVAFREYVLPWSLSTDKRKRKGGQ